MDVDHKIKLGIMSSVGIFCVLFFLRRNKYRKSISFSFKDEVNYIPTNNELLDYKQDLYYSSNDFKHFSYEANNIYDWELI